MRRGVERSAACVALSFLAETLPDEREHRVGDLDWSGEAREGNARKGATTATVTTATVTTATGADAKSARVS